MKIDVLRHNRRFFAFSFGMILFGAIGLGVFGLNLGIDFTGGSLLELQGQSDSARVFEIAQLEGVPTPSVTSSGDNQYLLRYGVVEDVEPVHQQLLAVYEEAGFEELRFEAIGPSVSSSLLRNAIYSIVFLSIGVIVYVSYTFRTMPPPVRPMQYGVVAIIALLHDAFIVIGMFAWLGWLSGVEVDSFFVTAVLTVIAFSIHDTLVIFDRVREKLLQSTDQFHKVVARSVGDVFVRSLNTSLTLVLVLTALLFFGGGTIKSFVLALLMGAIVGTYSSIFLAAPLVVTLHDWLKSREKKFKEAQKKKKKTKQSTKKKPTKKSKKK